MATADRDRHGHRSRHLQEAPNRGEERALVRPGGLVWVGAGELRHARALAYAEVPCCCRGAGNYVFLREGYGRMAGFLWGWVRVLHHQERRIAALATMFPCPSTILRTADSSGMGAWFG